MGLLFKRKKKPVEVKTTTIPIQSNSFLNYLLGGGERVSASQAFSFYRQNSAIATAVDLIGGSFEQIQPVIQDNKGNFSESNEILDLLMNPNGFQTWEEFAGQLARHYLLKHDSHIVAVGNINHIPIELFAVKPQHVVPYEDMSDSFPGQYVINVGAGKGIYVRTNKSKFYSGRLKEIYHIMGFSSSGNNVEGDSPLSAAALEARQQIAGRTHNLKLIKNGGRLSMVVSFKDQMRISDDEHVERRDRIREQLAGEENAGKVAVISAPDLDIVELGKSNKDMDYSEMDKVAGNAIYLRYMVPLPLISNEASTFNNMVTAMTMLYDNAVLPLADKLFAGLTKMIMARNGDRNIRITYNPEKITAIRSRQLDDVIKRKKAGIETIDEMRSMIPGRLPIEGGDKVYQPVNLVPVGTSVFGVSNGKPIVEEPKNE